ncbi:MAG: YfiR family protein [Proteobacteria bacterium]|nr:YfiR family protein [Pseudomonadota bacterium]
MSAGASFAACLTLLLGPAAGAEPTRTAESATYGEDPVKAAFPYNLAKFTEWPSDAHANGAAPLRVCVLGRDPFGTALETIEGKRIKERLVATLRIARLDQARRCQVLYIGASERDRLPDLYGSLSALLGMSFNSKLLSLAETNAGHFGPRISRVQPDG